MPIDRSKPATPRVSTLAIELSDLHGPCVGCCDCMGLCTALIDALVIPDLVLSKRPEAR